MWVTHALADRSSPEAFLAAVEDFGDESRENVSVRRPRMLMPVRSRREDRSSLRLAIRPMHDRAFDPVIATDSAKNTGPVCGENAIM